MQPESDFQFPAWLKTDNTRLARAVTGFPGLRATFGAASAGANVWVQDGDITCRRSTRAARCGHRVAPPCMNSNFSMLKPITLLQLFLVFLACALSCQAGLPEWDLNFLKQPPATHPAENIKPKNPAIHSLFFEGLPYEGKPTRVFAYMGVPSEAGEKVPGIVLIHGGGGTAYEWWVDLWMKRGYAAIAIDVAGTLPEPPDAKPRPQHAHSGPPGFGGFEQIDKSVKDQWTYHAAGAAILANSLLREQPGVDPDRIGLTGISWGGYLTCVTAGIDDRFRFAIPVYGCGFYEDTKLVEKLREIGPERAQRWLSQWDASHYLPRAKMPVLWVNGTNDFYFWPPAWQKSYRQTATDRRTLSLHPRLPHNHNAGAEPPEIGVFADSVVKQGKPLVTVLEDGKIQDTVSVRHEGIPIVRAELIYTADVGKPWPDRVWKSLPAHVTGDVTTAQIPSGAKYYYINLIDNRDCVVSTEIRPDAGQAAGDSQ